MLLTSPCLAPTRCRCLCLVQVHDGGSVVKTAGGSSSVSFESDMRSVLGDHMLFDRALDGIAKVSRDHGGGVGVTGVQFGGEGRRMAAASLFRLTADPRRRKLMGSVG